MALLFIDSFDHYTTITDKWTTAAGSISANGRTGANALAPSNQNTKGLVSSGATYILGAAFKLSSLSTTYAQLEAGNGGVGGSGHVGVYIQPDGSLAAKRTTSTELGRSAAGVISHNVWAYIELKVLIDNANGTVEIRVNGNEVLSLTGQDTQTGASATWTMISVAGTGYIDDLYVCDGSGGVNDDFLGDVRIDAHLPSGGSPSGSTLEWTPSAGENYACVDDSTPNGDTDYVSTDTLNAIDTYEFADLANAGGTMLGLQVLAYCKKADAGTCSIAPVVRPLVTNRVGTTVAIGTSYAYHVRQVYDVSPEDSGAWDEAEYNATEFGVKKIA